ncbi:hypothetical protein G9A89_014520 [Geosiphon pyriformis]|nr:hypothetical protein G9A89_014520 [Geosiphon pyriformis]
MTYTPIAKLKKFTDKKNNIQVWLNNIEKAITANGWNDTRAIQAIPYFFQDTVNLWYQSLVNKPQDFNAFKINILQCVCPIHPVDLQAAITNAKNFEATELETNHTQTNLGTGHAQNMNFQHYLSLLITPKDAIFNNLKPNQKQPLISNISLATISNDKSLVAIFYFEFEKTTPVLLFNGAALDTKPITAMYTNVKVDGHTIKLILDSGLAGSIITKQLIDQLGYQVDHAASTRIITADGVTKTSIGEIDNFPIKVNGITVPIKVLVMKTTQYQALIGNKWLSKTNAMLD